jgi:hydrogenase expression/formation protein HypC
MCISLPGRIVSLRGPMALVETAGVERWCNALAYPELEPGDRVLLHAGLVVRILSEDEARETEAAFAELGVLASERWPASISPADGCQTEVHGRARRQE